MRRNQKLRVDQTAIMRRQSRSCASGRVDVRVLRHRPPVRASLESGPLVPQLLINQDAVPPAPRMDTLMVA
ncbi:hypothetical protein DNTS_017177 [Danionella cerebrum]|uniref:Uncharacterized protein n=1 Tax=Danionella cerebrum TaxID=2873325 RepID=A0A553Q6J3_9TELE|nr:hypothetical protein DNTS_017177 [Danionella translucida]